MVEASYITQDVKQLRGLNELRKVEIDFYKLSLAFLVAAPLPVFVKELLESVGLVTLNPSFAFR